MLAEGMQTRVPMERLSVMGLVEVLGRLRELLRIRRELVDYLKQERPDVFIGIDAPDFTLGVEQRLRDAGIPTVHYVSPSVWAWREKRVLGIAQSTDLMLTLFPFEEDVYRRIVPPRGSRWVWRKRDVLSLCCRVAATVSCASWGACSWILPPGALSVSRICSSSCPAQVLNAVSRWMPFSPRADLSCR